MYNYDMYDSGLYGAGAIAGALTLLSFVAFVAAIVVTVLFYRKFIATGKPVKQATGKRDWGPFFRFDSLIIEKLLEALYIFTSAFILFEGAAFIISSFFGIVSGPEAIIGILIAIVTAVITVFFFELFNRLAFEWTMMIVLICKNTTIIRKKLTGDATPNPFDDTPAYEPSAPIFEPRFVKQSEQQQAQPWQPAAPEAPQAPVPAPIVNPAAPVATQAEQDAQVMDDSWVCSKCGHGVKAGSKYCPYCGHPNE